DPCDEILDLSIRVFVQVFGVIEWNNSALSDVICGDNLKRIYVGLVLQKEDVMPSCLGHILMVEFVGIGAPGSELYDATFALQCHGFFRCDPRGVRLEHFADLCCELRVDTASIIGKIGMCVRDVPDGNDVAFGGGNGRQV